MRYKKYLWFSNVFDVSLTTNKNYKDFEKIEKIIEPSRNILILHGELVEPFYLTANVSKLRQIPNEKHCLLISP